MSEINRGITVEDCTKRIKALEKDCDGLREELRRARGENEMLKECIVRMALGRYGVAND